MKQIQHNPNNNSLAWYIFYTTPRAEKVVYRDLEKNGMEVFLPLRKVSKIWKNRQHKIIEEPIFPSYIFIKTNQNKIYSILRHPKICTYISFLGKPSTISEKDIEAIKIMISSEETIETNEFYEGEKVRVIRGVLNGYEGILCSRKGKNNFGIKIQGVDIIASIEISISDVIKI